MSSRFVRSSRERLVRVHEPATDYALERGDHARVELVAGAAAQLVHGIGLGDCRPVRACAGHRIVCVADRDDTRPERNRLAS